MDVNLVNLCVMCFSTENSKKFVFLNIYILQSFVPPQRRFVTTGGEVKEVTRHLKVQKGS